MPVDTWFVANHTVFNCHDYSNIIDVDVYKGGYDEYLYKIYYTTPDLKFTEKNKKVYLMCLSDLDFKSGCEVDNKFRFLKSVQLASNNNSILYTYFIFICEELSVSENRSQKITEILY